MAESGGDANATVTHVLVGDDVWYWEDAPAGLHCVPAKVLGYSRVSNEYELMLFRGAGGSVTTTFAQFAKTPMNHHWTLRKAELLGQKAEE